MPAITNINGLQNINNDLAGTYWLMNDIDASATAGWNGGLGFVPIGTYGAAFTGSFDGRGYTISDLTINRPTGNNIGLFGAVDSGGIIRNVNLESPTIMGSNYVGGIIGYIDNNIETFSNLKVIGGTIQNSAWYIGGIIGAVGSGGTTTPTFRNCSSSAAITGATNANGVGGFIGYDYGHGTIYNRCSATGVVSSAGSSYFIGGFIGYVLESYTTFIKCYATGNVSGYRCIGGFVGESDIDMVDSEINYSECYASGSVTGNRHVGGFGGELAGTCTDCYARGAVTGTGTNYVGGFAAWSNVLVNCYSTGLITGAGSYIGGLVGRNYGTVANSFWDTQTSGTEISAGGTGKTTSQMKTKSTFTGAGWDFIVIWGINGITNDGYPFFWASPPEPMPESPRTTVLVEDKITLESIRNVEMASMGKFRVNEEGKAVYRSRHARNP